MSKSVTRQSTLIRRERRKPDAHVERETASGRGRVIERCALTVQTITRVAELASLRAEYERLNRESRLPLPFTLHEWHCAWCDHFLSRTIAIQDSLLVYIVRTGAGECVGIVPMVHTRRSVGPFSVSSLNLLGADQALTEIRMPLIAAGFHAAVARIVQAQLAGTRRWDWVQWMGVTTAFEQGVSAATVLQWQEPLLDYVLDLPGDWETFRKSLKRNIRESLRHCYNSLKRDKLDFVLVALERPEDIQAGLDQFLRLHAMRARFAGGTLHRDYFDSATAQAFLRDVCARLAVRNITRIYQLRVGGQLVATRIGFVLDDTLYLYYSGFNPHWSRYSVMTTALAEIIKSSIAHGLRTINLSPGTDVGKTRWSPHEVRIGQLLQVGGRLWSKAARSAYERSTRADGGSWWMAKVFSRAQRRWSSSLPQ